MSQEEVAESESDGKEEPVNASFVVLKGNEEEGRPVNELTEHPIE